MHSIAASSITLKKQQSASIDAARVFAVILVVVQHVIGGEWCGITGVTIFIALSLGLLRSDKSWAEFTEDRARRLLIPWIAWCGIYSLILVGIMALSVLLGKHFPQDSFKPEMLLYGPRIHLWYLPYLFFTSLIVYALLRAQPHGAVVRRIITTSYILVTCAAIVTVSYVMRYHPISGYPFQQWLTGIPEVCIGLSYRSLRNDSKAGALLATLLAITGIAALYAGFQYGTGYAGPIACALVVLGIVWAAEGKWSSPAWLQYCSGLTFGVYLAHIAILSVLRHGTKTEGGLRIFAYTLIAIVASALLTAVIQKLWPQRLKRWAIV